MDLKRRLPFLTKKVGEDSIFIVNGEFYANPRVAEQYRNCVNMKVTADPYLPAGSRIVWLWERA